jgi:hypothetical protein
LSNPPNAAVSRKNPHRSAGAFSAARKPCTDVAHATPTQRALWHFGLPGKSRGWGGHYGLAVRPSLRVVLYASVAGPARRLIRWLAFPQ